MNIFYLDKNVTKCAKYHNDKHVVKMILETAQLLCGAHWATGGEAPYKLSHKNHPSAIWTRTNIENYRWLCMLGRELCHEYTRRYGKYHKTSEVLTWCCDNLPNIPEGKFFEPPMAMPEHCKIGNSSILSYRNYYMTEKKSFSTWKNGETPEWFK
jgi:hypothetical protein